jgi:GDPmannose 4,6-dehydratase
MVSVLITGAGGQDGSYLTDRLLDRGWMVHALVRGGSPEESEQPLTEAAHRVEADLADLRAVGEVIARLQPDVIVNLAGISSVAQSWEHPQRVAMVNGVAVGTMLEAAWQVSCARSTPVRFIQASSAELFGKTTDDPQTEQTKISPSSPYGASKAFAHHLVGVYRARGLAASAAILYNHESPRRPLSFVTRKITHGVAAIAEGRARTIELGNLDTRRDWGWAPDYVDAIVRMIDAEKHADYIVATGETHSVEEFVEEAFSYVGITDWRPYVTFNADWVRPVDAPNLRGDSAKIRQELGWEPTKGFSEVVAEMVRNDLELARLPQ